MKCSSLFIKNKNILIYIIYSLFFFDFSLMKFWNFFLSIFALWNLSKFWLPKNLTFIFHFIWSILDICLRMVSSLSRVLFSNLMLSCCSRFWINLVSYWVTKDMVSPVRYPHAALPALWMKSSFDKGRLYMITRSTPCKSSPHDAKSVVNKTYALLCLNLSRFFALFVWDKSECIWVLLMPIFLRLLCIR